MTKRLQVLLEDAELRGIQRVARGKGLTTAAWVRQVLRTASEFERRGDPRRKLEAVRRATRHTFPVADIDQLLSEIERGYITPDAD
jgi:hypothetical protein